MSGKKSGTMFLTAGCLAAAMALPGCQDWPLRTNAVLPLDAHGQIKPAAPQVADRAAERAVLARSVETDRQGRAHSVWVHAIEAEPYRWQYRNLEELMNRPADQRVDFRRAAADADPIVAANAAIALGRLGDAAAVEPLARAVRMPTLPLPMRCAAAESLAALNTAKAAVALRGLLDQYQGSGKGSVALPELHAELLRGLAKHAEPADDAYFERGLASASVEVKLAAMSRWKSGGELPKEAVALRGHSDPRVRAAVLDAMNRACHPDIVARAIEATNDTDLNVRLTAIRCLGAHAAEDETAQAKLRSLLDKTQTEWIRTAAVAALAEAHCRDLVLNAVEDESWRVRQKVAESLATLGSSPPHPVAVVHKLLRDPSSQVQQQAVRSLGAWPVAAGGPLLLDALESTSLGVRRDAAATFADLLTSRATEMRPFPFDAAPQQRTAALETLRAQFRQEFPQTVALASATSPAKAASTDGEQRQIDEWIEQLGSPEVIQRRRVSGELARQAVKQPLSAAAVERIYARSAAEPDALVWQNLLAAAAHGGPMARQLAYAGLSHASAEVRRRACELLAQEPSMEHARALLATLDDKNATVVVAALRALGAAGRLDNPEPVRRLLGSSHSLIVLEAALTLTRMGDRAGLAALERLAYSSDPQVQCQAAEAIGQWADPSLVPALVRLLDAPVSVQRAALAALPRCAGQDIAALGQPPRNTSERITRWKNWAAKRMTKVE